MSRAVGGEHRQPVLADALGRGLHRAGVDVGDQDVRHAGSIRRVGDRAAVRRPVRKDVQRAVDGDAARVGAVVVRDVDLLHVALLDRADHGFAIAIRRERQLRLRHAAQLALRFVQARPTWCARRAAGSPPSRCTRGRTSDCASAHVIQAQLHANAGRHLLHGADHHAVGAELAPAIVRHRVDRRRRRNALVGVARNHVELALEIQIVPQHLADDARRLGRFAIVRKRQQIGHGDACLGAGIAGRAVTPTVRRLLAAGVAAAAAAGLLCSHDRADAATISGCRAACNRTDVLVISYSQRV